MEPVKVRQRERLVSPMVHYTPAVGAVHGLQVVTLVRSDKAEPAEAVEVEIMTTVEI